MTKDYTNIILEEINGKFDFVVEAVGQLQDNMKLLATKVELAAVDSKFDLLSNAFQDMNAKMATKKDLATLEKNIRKDMATKEDLAQVYREMATKDDLTKVYQTMATKSDLAEATTAIRKDMATKADLAEGLGKLEFKFDLLTEANTGIIRNMATKTELNEVKEDVKIIKSVTADIGKVVRNHGIRIARLEAA